MVDVKGTYSEHGYTIWTIDDVELYHAGNHALDSKQDATDTRHQLSLKTIKEFCEQTGQDLADELGGKLISVVKN